mmetsp:Transcript_7342/g.16070  ORF Transcript_7342/g.16070 Transcript_7342/m.16070 type:complete len:117 (-) Transcript_7342:514-864(-)
MSAGRSKPLSGSRLDRLEELALSRQQARKEEKEREEEEEGADYMPVFCRLWERAEYYVFLAAGSFTWFWLVFKVLDWHKFPVHLYPFHLWAVVLLPILMIVIMLYIMDLSFHRKSD